MKKMASKRLLSAGFTGDDVLALRQRLGWTQEQLAAELNVRQQTISEWECRVHAPRGGRVRLLQMVEQANGHVGTHVGGPGN